MIIGILYLLRFNLRRLSCFRPHDDYLTRDLYDELRSPMTQPASTPPSSVDTANTPESLPTIADESTKLITEPISATAQRQSKFGRIRRHSIAMLKSIAYDHHYSERDTSHKSHSYFHNRFEHPVFRVISVIAFSVILLIGLLLLVIFQFVFLGAASGGVFLSLLFIVCFVLFRRYERNTANTLFAFFLLFIMFIGGVFILGNIQMQRADLKPHAMRSHFVSNQSSMYTYDICQDLWFNYTIIDYAFFSYLAYEPEPFFSQDLLTWFPDCSDCRIIAQENNTVYFFDLYIPNRNLSVIAVRGTDTLVDVIQDMDLWKEVGLLQLYIWQLVLTMFLVQVYLDHF